MGLHPIHSSIAICSISSRPKLLMHQAIPERSINWPINSSSGTRVASCSSDSWAYLLVMQRLSHMHPNGVVDVGSPCFGRVTARAFLLGLLALGHHPLERAVDLRSQREPDVVG